MIHVRYLRESDRMDPPDQRTVSFIVAGRAIEHAHKPSRWDRAKWVAAFLLTGLALGAVIVAVVNYAIKATHEPRPRPLAPPVQVAPFAALATVALFAWMIP